MFKTSNPRRIGKGSLVGSFDCELPSGLKINGMLLFEKDGRRWVNPPSKEWTDREGAKKYLPILEFTSPEVKDRFQAQVVPLAEQALGLRTESPKAAEPRPENWRDAGIYGEKRAPLDDEIPF
jgi:hypothetical protein